MESKFHGVTFAPYARGQVPGDQLSVKVIERRIRKIAPYFEWIRIFSTTEGHEHIPAIAKRHGLKTLVGSFLDNDTQKNKLELDNLIDLCNRGLVDLASIGNESLHSEYVKLPELEHIRNRVKSKIPFDIPVGFCAIDWEYEEYPELLDMFDVNFIHVYPFWEYYDITESMERLNEKYQLAKQLAGDKRVIISETGWPSQGEHAGGLCEAEHAYQYFTESFEWAKKNNVELFHFNSFDEAWKGKDCRSHRTGGEVEEHWGIWDADENIKPHFKKLFVEKKFRRRDKIRDYLRMRIDMLAEERAKNNDEVAHMVLDKSVGELCYVLEYLERESEL